MMSLFNTFDMKFFNFNMIILIFSLIYLLMNFFFNNKIKLIFSKFVSSMDYFFLSLKFNNFNKFLNVKLISIMMLMVWVNFSSVLGFNFAATSQVSVVFFLALSMWISFISFSYSKNLKGALMHNIPEGTPIYLTWFLFLIEIISNTIRPLTITVRMVANILAGHLLMILLSGMVSSNKNFVSLYLILNLVEMFVSLIQAYIFSTMLTLYYSEL